VLTPDFPLDRFQLVEKIFFSKKHSPSSSSYPAPLRTYRRLFTRNFERTQVRTRVVESSLFERSTCMHAAPLEGTPRRAVGLYCNLRHGYFSRIETRVLECVRAGARQHQDLTAPGTQNKHRRARTRVLSGHHTKS